MSLRIFLEETLHELPVAVYTRLDTRFDQEVDLGIAGALVQFAACIHLGDQRTREPRGEGDDFVIVFQDGAPFYQTKPLIVDGSKRSIP